MAGIGCEISKNFRSAATALYDSGMVHYDNHNNEKARSLLEEAKWIYKEKLGTRGHPKLTEICNKLANIKKSLSGTSAVERSASGASVGRKSVANASAESSGASVGRKSSFSVGRKSVANASAESSGASVGRKSVANASAESSGASVGRKSFSGASYDRIIKTVAISNPSSDVRKIIEDADFVPSKKCKEELLDIAIAPTGRPSLVTLSVEQGADPHSPNRDGYSPLQRAIIFGNVDSAEVLIEEQGIDLYFRCRNNHTAMYYAAVHGCWEIIYVFIKKGIDPNYSEDGSRLIHYAAIGGHVDVIRILIEQGANCNSPNRDGDTPIWLAAVNNHQEAVEMFIERGADFCSPNKDGDTLMHYAARNGWYHIVKLLIEQGANCNSPNRDGDTPIWLAARGDYYGIVELLIEQGANCNSPNRDGDTLIDYARRNDRTNVLGLLERIASYNPSSNLDSLQPIGKDAVFRGGRE